MNPFDERQRQVELNAIAASIGGTLTNVPQQFQAAVREFNMINLDPQTEIYRIFSFDRFIEMVGNGRNSLVRPVLWDDTFENFLMGANGIYQGHPVSFEPVRDSWYGQCWTFKKECDGMWRANTRENQRAVKVKTTVGRLFESFYDFNNQFHNLSYFIGKVDYIPKGNIPAFLTSSLGLAAHALMNTSNISQMMTLLTKREEFEYESELRLLYCEPNRGLGNQLAFQYNINPNALFDEAILDPFTPDISYPRLVAIIRQTGFANRIAKSDLYEKNTAVIQIP